MKNRSSIYSIDNKQIINKIVQVENDIAQWEWMNEWMNEWMKFHLKISAYCQFFCTNTKCEYTEMHL